MGYNIKTLACPCKFKQIHDVNNWIATYIESFKFAQVTGWQIINNSSWVFKLLQWSTTVIENYNLSRKSDNWTPENAIHIILSRQHWDEADYESMEYLRQGLIANRFQVFLCWRIWMAIQQHPIISFQVPEVHYNSDWELQLAIFGLWKRPITTFVT